MLQDVKREDPTATSVVSMSMYARRFEGARINEGWASPLR
jgi:hypothetical protein